MMQGEDEVMFMEYRKELKVLFDNITQLVSICCSVRSVRVFECPTVIWFHLFFIILCTKKCQVNCKAVSSLDFEDM